MEVLWCVGDCNLPTLRSRDRFNKVCQLGTSTCLMRGKVEEARPAKGAELYASAVFYGKATCVDCWLVCMCLSAVHAETLKLVPRETVHIKK